MDNGKRIKYENILRHLEEAMYNMKSEEALTEEVEELDFMLEIVNVELLESKMGHGILRK